MSCKLEWKGNNAIVNFKGETTFDEIITVSNTIIGNARFNYMDYAIYNYLAVENYNLDDEDIVVMATLNKSASLWNQHIRLALVDNDNFIAKMLKDYIHLMDDIKWEIKRFDNFEDSLKWCKESKVNHPHN